MSKECCPMHFPKLTPEERAAETPDGMFVYEFSDEESTMDTILSEWVMKVGKTKNEPLKAKLNELTTAFSKFQAALTSAGYKGCWNSN